MNKTEEFELISEIRNNNSEEAKIKLYKQYELLIHDIAKRYINSTIGLQYQDLVAEGTVGLFYALKKFDTSKGVKFDTYAYSWIRERILSAIKASQRKVYVPFTKSHTACKIRNLIQDAEKMNLPKEETNMYIMSNLRVDQKKFQKLMNDYELIELSRNIQDYDNCISVQADTIRTGIDGVIEEVYTKDMKKIVKDALESLDDLEQKVILALFFEGKKLSEVANDDMDKKEIIKIRKQAMRKLKVLLKDKV